MQTSLRNLEQLKDREDGGGRRAGLLALAALCTVGLIVAVGTQLQRSTDEGTPADEDPLAGLARVAVAAEAATPAAPPSVAAPPASPTVDRAKLAFPAALTSPDRRPEVEAAVAAAAAEAEALASPPPPDIEVPPSLPAALAADPATAPLLARAPESDPLLAAVRPSEPEAGAREAPRSGPGEDGPYVLQVISYQNHGQARAFADALRARGHKAFVAEAAVADRGIHYRVRVGPFRTLGEAQRYRRSFEQAEQMNTIVVQRSPG